MSESEEKVRKLFSEKLKLDHRKIELNWTHRVGKPMVTSEKPRPIVRFLWLKDKVLDKAKNLKGSGIFFLMRTSLKPSGKEGENYFQQ